MKVNFFLQHRSNEKRNTFQKSLKIGLHCTTLKKGTLTSDINYEVIGREQVKEIISQLIHGWKIGLHYLNKSNTLEDNTTVM